MEHYRLRKYRGPETWARVRKAYEAGESGPSCALRFDVGLSNLRKRARNEGWDRKSQARKNDLKPMRGEADPTEPAVPMVPISLKGCASGDVEPEFNPLEAATIAARKASWRAAQGDGRGAMEMLKVADHLGDILAKLEVTRMRAAQADRAEAHAKREQEQLKAMDLEDVLSSLRRDILDKRQELEDLKADLADAYARLAGTPAPAQPEAGEPEAKPAEPAPKPKLSFEERVRLASGKSGPVSRW